MIPDIPLLQHGVALAQTAAREQHHDRRWGLAEPGWLNVAEEHDDQRWHAGKQQGTQAVVPARNGQMINEPDSDSARTARGKSAL